MAYVGCIQILAPKMVLRFCRLTELGTKLALAGIQTQLLVNHGRRVLIDPYDHRLGARHARTIIYWFNAFLELARALDQGFN